MVRKSPAIGSSPLPPFLKKCYKMVDDEETNSIISWSQNSNSFVILDMAEFTLRLLPKYFKHNNLSSFIRQLNYYGFRKVDTDRWEYSNNGFIRGQKHLLKNISKRKITQDADQQKGSKQQDNSDEQSGEDAYFGLMKEVKSLKADRKALTQELVKLSQQLESTENRLLLLSDRLQGMEKNQQQMLSFLVMAIQSPDILGQLFQPKERNWLLAEAGIIKEQGNPGDGPVFSDGVIVRYKQHVSETEKPILSPSSGSEEHPRSDSSEERSKDLSISDDFLELLMDENPSPPDNHSPLILPDLPDDGTMEKLLFDCRPFLKNDEDSMLEDEGSIESGMGMEPIMPQNPIEKSQDSEFLVAQMEK